MRGPNGQVLVRNLYYRFKIHHVGHNAMRLIRLLFSPLIFGLAFLTPLIAQVLTTLGWQPAGVDPIWIGLMLGGGLGMMAQIRGSWFWVKS